MEKYGCEESRKQHANPISEKNVVTRKREKYQEIKRSISHLHDEQCQTTAKTTHSPPEHKAQGLTYVCTKLPTRQDVTKTDQATKQRIHHRNTTHDNIIIFILYI